MKQPSTQIVPLIDDIKVACKSNKESIPSGHNDI